jgi:hypothetical protein
LDFGFWIDPTDKSEGLRILDFGFWICSTDKSGGLYHQGIIGHPILDFGFWIDPQDLSAIFSDFGF